MLLPVPNEREVEAFRKIYKDRTGIELDGQQALEVSMRVLQIFYIRTYGLEGEAREREIAQLFRKNVGPDHGDLPK